MDYVIKIDFKGKKHIDYWGNKYWAIGFGMDRKDTVNKKEVVFKLLSKSQVKVLSKSEFLK